MGAPRRVSDFTVRLVNYTVSYICRVPHPVPVHVILTPTGPRVSLVTVRRSRPGTDHRQEVPSRSSEVGGSFQVSRETCVLGRK